MIKELDFLYFLCGCCAVCSANQIPKKKIFYNFDLRFFCIRINKNPKRLIILLLKSKEISK